MSLPKLADQFLLLTAKEYAIPSHTEEFKFLKRVDAGPNHSLSTANMSPADHIIAKKLAEKGWIELIKEDHGVSRDVAERDWRGNPTSYHPKVQTPISRKVPERYVMLTGGSYALGTFDSDTRSEEERALMQAMWDNKGVGMNIHFRGQHFGWFRWDKKKKKHIPFSIATFKNSDSVGELEETVAALKNIKLEDYV